MDNPFQYGSPVTGEHFAGREEELDLLVSRMVNTINVAVTSRRRIGKTSLLLRACDQVAAQSPKGAVVFANVFMCKDISVLASRLVSGIYAVSGQRVRRATQAVAEFARGLRVRPRVEIGDDGKPRFQFLGLDLTDGETIIEDVYRLLNGESAKRPAVLVLDEFQAITRFGPNMPDLFKGLADGFRGVSLVVAGSHRRMMDALVTGEGAPLYGMCQRLALTPVPEHVMVEYVGKRMALAGRTITPEAAVLLYRLAGPVPNDVQHLAFETFEKGVNDITEELVLAALGTTVDHEAATFADRAAELSEGQLRVVIALASLEKPGPIFTGAFARSVGLAGGQSVKKAIATLADDDTVVREGGYWRIGNPFFAAWLRQAG